MRRLFYYILFLFAALILQVTIFSRLPAAPYGPNLILVIVFSVGFISGSQTGTFIGFIAGFIQDLMLGGGIGFYTVANMLLGASSSLFKDKVYRESFPLIAGLIFGFTFLYESLIFLLSEHTFLRIPIAQALFGKFLPSSLYTMLVGTLLYIFIIHIIPPGGSSDEREN